MENIKKPYKWLDKLNPDFRKKVDIFLKDVWEKIFVVETWRSWARQDYLFEKWLSQTRDSNHEYWLAIDIAFRWDEPYPNDLRKWKEIAKIANKYWIDWLYDLWAKWDKVHFQDNWKKLEIEEKTRFTDIMNESMEGLSIKPIFNSFKWEKKLTERETKELIQIAINRLIAEIRNWI